MVVERAARVRNEAATGAHGDGYAEEAQPPVGPRPARQTVRWLDDDQQHSWRALLVGMQLLLDRLDEDLKDDFALSLVEYEILVRLSEADGRLRMSQLADSLAHSRSRVTHTVKRMEAQGLLERCDSTEDRRGVVASLTAAGTELLDQMAPVHVRGVRRCLVDLVSREDLTALGRVMDAVADHLIGDRADLDIRQS